MSNLWAEELERAKRNGPNGNGNFELQKKQTRQELNYFKSNLQNALQEKDLAKTEDILKSLIDLRIKAFKQELADKKEGLTPMEINLNIERMVEECVSLIGSCYQPKK
jgi:hypothetical protein